MCGQVFKKTLRGVDLGFRQAIHEAIQTSSQISFHDRRRNREF